MAIIKFLAFCLLSFLVRGMAFASIPYRRVREFLGRMSGRGMGVAAMKMIGSVRLLGPETWLKVIERAIVKLRTEDPNLYSAISASRQCLIFAGGTPKGDLQFELGVFFLNKAFVKSEDALVSLFVFWRFFEEGNSIFQRANPETVNRRKVQAREQTAKWLEDHGRPSELVQWLKESGLEKRVNPPANLKG